MSRLVIGLVAAVTLLGLVGSATGGLLGRETDRYEAELTREAVVPTPKNVRATAHGQFVAFYVKKTRTLIWLLRFGDLKSRATAADIHLGPEGKNGRVLVHLCGSCPNPSEGTIRLTVAQGSAFKLNRRLYVSIQTVGNPAGEIRGQLHMVIDPRQGCQPC